MIESAPNNLTVQTFSWKRALFGAYDVLHVHWPENLIRGRSRASTYAKRILFVLLVVRLWLLRRPVVRTLHNIDPHEQGGMVERQLLKLADVRTDYFIALNSVTPIPGDKPARTILHGHYRNRPEYQTTTEPDLNRLLYFGLIRPYKGVEDLIAAFSEIRTSNPSINLRIVGKPQDQALKEHILDTCRRSNSITSRLEFVPDRDLGEEIAGAGLVVLPYREMHNSGSVLLALSMNRPVLVPDTDVNRALQQEVGPGWVYLFSGGMSAATLGAVLTSVTSDERSAQPQMSGRDWDVVGEQHYRVYVDAVNKPVRLHESDALAR
ncbi:glycosyltransferase [Rhodococcus sp. AB351]|uniref:glycosyltransferase n=1 Tax=Rhodococcus sp. AB351 TaxID=3413280 RepID=UPI003C1D83D4